MPSPSTTTSASPVSPCPAWRTPTATPSTVPSAAGSTAVVATSGAGASRCTQLPSSSTPTRTSLSPERCSPRWFLAGFTVVGEFHYVHHRPGGHPYGNPNAMGLAVRQAAEEAGIRLTLLDTCYLEGGGLNGGGHVELHPGQRRFSDGTVDAWAERIGPLTGDRPGAARRGDPLRASRAPRGSAPGRQGLWCAPPARPPLGAARREPRLSDVLRPHPDGKPARRGGGARQQPDERACHPPDGARHRAARWHGNRRLHLPDDRA